MASDSEDFESYNPATPAPPKANGKAAKSTASRKTKATKRKRASPSPNPSDIEEIIPKENAEPVEDVEMIPDTPPPPPKRKATAKSSKGTRSTKGKAKTKEVEEPIELVEEEEEEQEEKLEDTRPKEPPKKAPKVKSVDTASRGPVSDPNDKHRIRELERSNGVLQNTNERLAKELDAARLAYDQLVKQFEELSRIRHTEPESLLKELKKQYDATTHAQDSLVTELKYQLSAFEPYSRLMNSRTLDYVRREDADKEKLDLEAEYQKVKEDVVIKDKSIAELENLNKMLQRDLDNEIKHSKSLASSKPTNNVISGSMDVRKHEALVLFYEDLTNLLVTNVKIVDSQYFKHKDILYSCIYSSEPGDDDEPSIAMNFTLRFYHEVSENHEGPVTSESQLVDAIGYTPLELDKEPPEFKERLKFLSAPFTFSKAQFPLFLREMHKAINEVEETSDDEHTSSVISRSK